MILPNVGKTIRTFSYCLSNGNNDDEDIEAMENVDKSNEDNSNIVFLQEVEVEDSGTESDDETETEQQDGEGEVCSK